MSSLNNLFIEMTEKHCNQSCKHCYIDFPKYKKCEDFIEPDIIKQTLEDTKNEEIKCIYLTGAEPMTHPEFNHILRMCLKYSNVCVCTNGSMINEKKARFLKKVEDEFDNQIIFKISIDIWDEIKNDDIRYRGAFRHGIFALKHLIKYDFTPIIAVTNYYNYTKNEIINGFINILKAYNLNFESSYIQINPWHDKTCTASSQQIPENFSPDCQNGRILTSQGIYSCPFLSHDYRGRCGSNFKDYSKKVYPETDFCVTCMASDSKVFGIDFDKFENQ